MTFIITSVVVCLTIWAIGTTFYYAEESRGDKMWVPRDAIAHKHQDYVA
jgi:hypothetical protein